MARKSLAPQQARSRESQRKLLQAALKVLAAQGLEGTTIPRIAAEAGLTPGAVYRRFPDKTALLETVLLTSLEGSLEHIKRTFTPMLAAKQPLPVLIEQIIGSLIASHRYNGGVVRSLRQLVLTSDHHAFRSKVFRLQQRTLEYLIEVLLTCRKEIRHPHPQLALSLALTVLVSTLLELFVVDAGGVTPPGVWPPFLPKDDASLRQELGRMVLRYLGHADADL
jgi:AcrR family transcriptional regulator